MCLLYLIIYKILMCCAVSYLQDFNVFYPVCVILSIECCIDIPAWFVSFISILT